MLKLKGVKLWIAAAAAAAACLVQPATSFVAQPLVRARTRASTSSLPGKSITNKLEDERASGRRAKQDAIRDVLSQRKPHQRKDCILPGSRVLLILSEDLRGPNEPLPSPTDEDGGVVGGIDTVYEATVEEVITKEKSHPLGIKVRVVGGKSGRVAYCLDVGENAKQAAKGLGVECLPVTANRGIRSALLASGQVGGTRHWTPYAITEDVWVPRGPAAKAAAQLKALGLLDDGAEKQRPERKFSRFGESGMSKMKRANN